MQPSTGCRGRMHRWKGRRGEGSGGASQLSRGEGEGDTLDESTSTIHASFSLNGINLLAVRRHESYRC